MRMIAVALALANCCAPNLPAADVTASWNEKAAASYLDGRMVWWMGWQPAARDHGTFCVSCHTVAPYAMARPSLRAALAETAISAPERKLLDNIVKRVRIWADVEPFYPDATRGVPKTAESRGTEAILNALILTGYDAPTGRLSADALLALKHMWAEQLKAGESRGGWSWLQFHNSPWEGDSQFYGATLAALAVGAAPAYYRATVESNAGMSLLREYLSRQQRSQTLIDRITLVWADANLPGILTAAERQSIVDEALQKQQPDGGFSLSSFVGEWKRRDKTPLEVQSDGYATGLVILVLQETGMSRDQLPLKRGLTWLVQHQEKNDGRWLAYSLNKQRDLASDVGRFMSDAATAYAVLALNPGQSPRSALTK